MRLLPGWIVVGVACSSGTAKVGEEGEVGTGGETGTTGETGTDGDADTDSDADTDADGDADADTDTDADTDADCSLVDPVWQFGGAEPVLGAFAVSGIDELEFQFQFLEDVWDVVDRGCPYVEGDDESWYSIAGPCETEEGWEFDGSMYVEWDGDLGEVSYDHFRLSWSREESSVDYRANGDMTFTGGDDWGEVTMDLETVRELQGYFDGQSSEGAFDRDESFSWSGGTVDWSGNVWVKEAPEGPHGDFCVQGSIAEIDDCKEPQGEVWFQGNVEAGLSLNGRSECDGCVVVTIGGEAEEVCK